MSCVLNCVDDCVDALVTVGADVSFDDCKLMCKFYLFDVISGVEVFDVDRCKLVC
jgi:hypothetical protein